MQITLVNTRQHIFELEYRKFATKHLALLRFCNDGGSCSSSQVGSILRSFGQNPSEAVIQDMIAQVDKDGSGMINFPEFLMMMAIKVDYENAEDEIREAFQVFDGVSFH